ncbi:hypothetical protein PLUTO_00570 [Luteibacter phage vB_LflM-Pluto]|uniref:Uncharacterized protein n=1 Tax=Luteibacter phage vB_LflM-Pluto TaxID=2948611 RepID=A0A9E7SL87_9CAUD|nr:hypothetical protein PLUTO_00570 [Luteibacter phage vB_LflM-Pluto]
MSDDSQHSLGPDITSKTIKVKRAERVVDATERFMLHVLFFVLGVVSTLWTVYSIKSAAEPCKVIQVCSLRDSSAACLKYEDVVNPKWSKWKLKNAAAGGKESLK